MKDSQHTVHFSKEAVVIIITEIMCEHFIQLRPPAFFVLLFHLKGFMLFTPTSLQ